MSISSTFGNPKLTPSGLPNAAIHQVAASKVSNSRDSRVCSYGTQSFGGSIGDADHFGGMLILCELTPFTWVTAMQVSAYIAFQRFGTCNPALRPSIRREFSRPGGYMPSRLTASAMIAFVPKSARPRTPSVSVRCFAFANLQTSSNRIFIEDRARVFRKIISLLEIRKKLKVLLGTEGKTSNRKDTFYPNVWHEGINTEMSGVPGRQKLVPTTSEIKNP